MQDFLFYISLGLDHVLDLGAYDHILFLSALAVPFTFGQWKKVLILATVFTLTHCLSLALSAYGVVSVDVALVEFLIPVTILLTALFNFAYIYKKDLDVGLFLHILATAFFGLIHGFGFSNYFRMLMAGEDDMIVPLLGFATGIELSQLTVILLVLGAAHLILNVLKVKRSLYIGLASLLIIAITIRLLFSAFPW